MSRVYRALLSDQPSLGIASILDSSAAHDLCPLPMEVVCLIGRNKSGGRGRGWVRTMSDFHSESQSLHHVTNQKYAFLTMNHILSLTLNHY